MVRFVPIGIWDDIFLEATDNIEISNFTCVTDADMSDSSGSIRLKGHIPVSNTELKVTLSKGRTIIREETVPASSFTSDGIAWTGLDVDIWWPNLEGDQPLYTVTCTLLNNGTIVDEITHRVGFRNVSWQMNEDSPTSADPWLCVVNGRPVFLQGVNWTPIRPNFADLTEQDYRRRLETYKDMGVNIFRVWGGAILEKEIFYNLCDEMGFMVWQEFPFSSSSFENWPPEDPTAIDEMRDIARSYINRRQHHASLIMWCGGNELFKKVPQENGGILSVAADLNHPMLAMLKEVVNKHDPTRRYIATSPSGPLFDGDPKDAGKGLHWDVHGPWIPESDMNAWKEYWEADDSLFRSEVGSPSASPIEILDKYAAKSSFLQQSAESPTWRRQFDFWWWMEYPKFKLQNGRDPENIEEYVTWSQNRQGKALAIAAKSCKDRFPKCGGFIIWMGQDCFPCTANTSIIDFNGDPKPAVLALKDVFRN
jgi:beta-mannosidase